MQKNVIRSTVKSKSAVNGTIEMNIEVRLKEDNTDFISILSEMPGVNSTVIVSYNGDYMGGELMSASKHFNKVTWTFTALMLVVIFI